MSTNDPMEPFKRTLRVQYILGDKFKRDILTKSIEFNEIHIKIGLTGGYIEEDLHNITSEIKIEIFNWKTKETNLIDHLRKEGIIY